MNFENRFQLLGVVRDDGISTSAAREIATGRDLQIHSFHVNSPDTRSLFDRIFALPLSERRELLEIGFEEKTPYIVTDPLPRATNARAWFTRLVNLGESGSGDKSKFTNVGVWKTVAPRKPDTAGTEAAPSEFTKIFEPPTEPDRAPASASLTKTVAIPSEVAPSQPGSVQSGTNQPGEFTRMFQATVPPKPPSPTPASVEDAPTQFIHAPAGQQPAPAPGEFTRMFLSPTELLKQPTAPAPAAPSRATTADERTRLFQAPVVERPSPPTPTAQHTSEHASEHAAEPGEFTRMFQPQATAPAPPSPASHQSGPGEFTRFFQSPMQPGPIPEPVQRPNVPPPAPNRAGEFTQMFGKPSQPQSAIAPPVSPLSADNSATIAFARTGAQSASHLPGQSTGEFNRMMSPSAPPTLGQSTPQQSATPVKKANPMLPLLIVLGVILSLAIVVLIFFAMRHR